MTDLERDVRNAPPLVGEMVVAGYALFGTALDGEVTKTVVEGDMCIVVNIQSVYWIDLLTPRGELVRVSAAHLLEWRKP